MAPLLAVILTTAVVTLLAATLARDSPLRLDDCGAAVKGGDDAGAHRALAAGLLRQGALAQLLQVHSFSGPLRSTAIRLSTMSLCGC